MAARTTDPLPARLEKARGRFDSWRKTRRQGERIPKRLWNVAVKAAAKHGPYKTALALRLDYMGLKRRMADSPRGSVAKREAPSFVEVTGAGVQSTADCVAWVESRSGARLRLDLRGLDASQLAAFARSFAGDLQ